MKIWKRYYTGRGHLWIAGTLLALFCSSVFVGAVDKDQYGVAKTMHLQAYSLVARANELRNGREWTESLKLYNAAAKIYDRLVKEFPTWKKDVVNERKDDCARQIMFIEQMLKIKSAAKTPKKTPTPKPVITPAPKPVVKPAVNAEIKKMELNNQELRKELVELRANIETMKNAHKLQLREKMTTLLDENESLRNQMAELRKANVTQGSGELRADIIKLTEDNVRLNEQLSNAYRDMRAMRTKELGIAKLGQRYEKVVAENKELLARLEKTGTDDGPEQEMLELKKLWRKRFEEFQKSIAEKQKKLTDENAKLTNENEAHKDIIERQGSMLDKVNDALKAVEDSRKGDKKKIKEFAKRFDKKQAELEKCMLALQENENEIKKLSVRLDTLKDAEKTIRRQTDKIEKLNAELTKAKSDCKSAVEDERNEWTSRMNEEQQSYEKRLTAFKEETEKEVAAKQRQVEKALIKAQSEIAERKKERTGMIARWQTEFERLSKQLDVEKTKVATLNEQQRLLKKHYEGTTKGQLIDEMNNDREKYQEALSYLRKSLKEIKNERDILRNRNFQLEGRVMEMQRRYNQIKKQSK